ncbi:MAG: TlpA family protein disulfide reductase [Nitrospirae bacterium]|nr:TlpA family protein disulfide reductase [Nitrospirota bacterium]
MPRFCSVLLLLICPVLCFPVRAFSVTRGEAAPAFALSDLQGMKHTLSDYTGKVVLINFWASWCGECITEMPSLNTVHTQFSDRGLAVLGVTVDRITEDARAAAKKARIAFPILVDARGEVFIRKYAVIGLPTTIVLDRKGVIREILVGSQDFQEKKIRDMLVSLLNERTAP